MNQKLCDLCGRVSDSPSSITFTYDGYCGKVLCDPQAKIKVSLFTNLVEHSTGYGGCPDLCWSCMSDIIRLLDTELLKIKPYEDREE